MGNGQSFGVNIAYSVETTELEVGGGIAQALPLLGNNSFAIVNGDIWTDYPLATLKQKNKGLAYLVLVDNPLHNQKGDFAILDDHHLVRATQQNFYLCWDLCTASGFIFKCDERRLVSFSALF